MKRSVLMIRSVRLLIVLCLALVAGVINIYLAKAQQTATCATIVENKDLYDKARKRQVPVALYLPAAKMKIKHQQVVILSHGYSAGDIRANRGYSAIAECLAAHGYFVASVQHELPGDDAPAMTGVLRETRRPNWERGVANILFALNELKRLYPALDYKHVALIGHSNGGDASVLFAHKYPELVDRIISLDNRRMPLPRVGQPKIYSLRSSDLPADEGVLPDAEEQKKYGITIVKLPNTIHNDMSDSGTEAQKKEINDHILRFLKEP